MATTKTRSAGRCCGAHEAIRSHGFVHPLHTLQLISWFSFGLFAVLFFLFYLCAMASPYSVVVGLLYSMFVIAVVYTAGITTATNCRDMGTGKPNDEMGMLDLDEDHTELDLSRTWCPYCQFYVEPDSKHCRLCDKCVRGFDHHCKWLNNCIGKKNYKMFIATLCSALSLLVLQTTLSVVMLIATFDEPAGNPFILQRLGAVYGGFDLSGLTTYSWIIQKRTKKRDAMARREIETRRKDSNKKKTSPKHADVVPAALKSTSKPFNGPPSHGPPSQSTAMVLGAGLAQDSKDRKDLSNSGLAVESGSPETTEWRARGNSAREKIDISTDEPQTKIPGHISPVALSGKRPLFAETDSPKQETKPESAVVVHIQPETDTQKVKTNISRPESKKKKKKTKSTRRGKRKQSASQTSESEEFIL